MGTDGAMRRLALRGWCDFSPGEAKPIDNVEWIWCRLPYGGMGADSIVISSTLCWLYGLCTVCSNY